MYGDEIDEDEEQKLGVTWLIEVVCDMCLMKLKIILEIEKVVRSYYIDQN